MAGLFAAMVISYRLKQEKEKEVENKVLNEKEEENEKKKEEKMKKKGGVFSGCSLGNACF